MFATLLRLGAIIAAPLALMGTASAQYDAPQDEAALILFSGPEYSGEAVNIFDPIYALPEIGFNDRARSVAVLSGAWEICEHSDFTGRCVLVREDVADLRYFDLDGDVSSVRPIYEYTDAAHGLMFIRDSNGYIRYADAARYGQDDYDYGYARSTRIEVYHYGYSPAYRSYGYYDPLAGYGPYGFGYSRGGLNTYRAYHHERPPLRGHYGARDADATLYVHSNGRGASLGINRGVKDLSRYRFNDNVSSLNIKSGRWEVCEHANFRGRCEIIDASTGKLNGLRLNDNISSIRPVDGDRDRGEHRGDRDRGDDRGDRGRRDGDGPRADGDRRDRGRRGEGDDRRGRNDDTLAGGPAALMALPVSPRAAGQSRVAPPAAQRGPIETRVRQPRIDRPDRDLARGAGSGRDANRAARSDMPRVQPETRQPRRTETRAVQPRTEMRRAAPPQQRVQTPQRTLPQTPAMRSRAPVAQPVQAAPRPRAPTPSAPQIRAPAVSVPAQAPVAAPPPPQPRANPRPQRSAQDGRPSPKKDRVGNNQN